MILDGCHFRYGDFNSRTLGLIFAHCDTKDYLELSGEMGYSTFFNRRDKALHIIDDDYTKSPVSFDAEIISDNFEAFTYQNRRAIEKALFMKPDYRKLYVDLDDDILADGFQFEEGYLRRFYFNCKFMNPSKIEDGRGLVVGYRFTIECDSCMLWQDPVEKEFAAPFDDDTFTLSIDTDIGDYTYPDVTIDIGSTGGDIIIFNASDNPSRLTKFNNLPAYAHIVMKGNINYVSGQNYEYFESQNFIRLLDGDNVFSVTGDVDGISFKWQNRRFI